MKTTMQAALIAVASTLPWKAPAQPAAAPLNILLITTDDQGRQAGCYGDLLAITPHMDRLAAEGALFEHAYVTHASCSPSRSSILTGLYPHQNGHIGLAGAHPEYRLKEGIATLPALLRDAGYINGILGKLHMTPHDAFPFDFEWAVGDARRSRDVREVARQARIFLDQRGDAPFFLYVNYFDPHRPYDAESNQILGLPEQPYGPEDITPLPYLGLDGPAIREEIAGYYNGINRMDVGLGLLLEQLKEVGVYDQTLIVFIGDHGPPFTRAKTTAYEEGIAVPLLLRWPGVSRTGLRSKAFVSSVDLAPTMLDAAGLSPPPVAGRSLREVLRDEPPDDWRDLLFAEYTSHSAKHLYPRRTVRNRQYKLIHNLDVSRPNPVPFIGATRITPNLTVAPNMQAAYQTMRHPPEYELYDLLADPHETRNLADRQDIVEVFEALKRALKDWREETGDPLLAPDELRRLNQAHGLP